MLDQIISKSKIYHLYLINTNLLGNDPLVGILSFNVKPPIPKELFLTEEDEQEKRQMFAYYT